MTFLFMCHIQIFLLNLSSQATSDLLLHPVVGCTDLYICILDAIPLIHVTSNQYGRMLKNSADLAEPVSAANHIKAHTVVYETG